jgi:hypothetical protein
VFAAAQLGAAQGIATATAMGVMTLAGVLPGAGVVAVSALRSRRAAVSPAGSASQDPADRRRGIRASGRKEAVHG